MPDFDFTVLVCTKDRPRQLVRCLEALLTLRHDAIEVIVVDNGSRNIEIPELPYTHPIRFYSYPFPGLSAARNAVIREIKGKILVLVDDDAVAHSEWLRSAANSF